MDADFYLETGAFSKCVSNRQSINPAFYYLVLLNFQARQAPVLADKTKDYVGLTLWKLRTQCSFD